LELLESINSVIHQIHVTGELNVQAKGKNDVFTEADTVIQKTIEINLRQLYPRAKIIGEEGDLTSSVQPFLMKEKRDKPLISQKMLFENFGIHKEEYYKYLC